MGFADFACCSILIWLHIEIISGLVSSQIGHDILFNINWAGHDIQQPHFKVDEVVVMKTKNDESYQCNIPNIKATAKPVTDLPYDGPNELQLLSLLFSENKCIVKPDQYWVYELCHGVHMRQYHTEIVETTFKTQEFFMGKWSDELYKKQQEELKKRTESEVVRKMHVRGVEIPYYEITMTGGTECEINKNPRVTRVLYGCNVDKVFSELVSIKELTSCEYQVVVLTPILCTHPKYRVEKSVENEITCIPLGNSPKKPRSVLQFEAQNLVRTLTAQKEALEAAVKAKTTKESKLQMEDAIKAKHSSPVVPSVLIKKKTTVSVDTVEGVASLGSSSNEKPSVAPLDDWSGNIWPGKQCLVGGGGWWRYEFCFGEKLEQFHIEPDGSQTRILLGTFDKETHLHWIKENQHKKPKNIGSLHQVVHFYGGGDICEETNEPRQAEVILQCTSQSPSSAVGLVLYEPKKCQYQLKVQSSTLCPVIAKADSNGLFEGPVFGGQQSQTDPAVATHGEAGRFSVRPSPAPTRGEVGTRFDNSAMKDLAGESTSKKKER